jgi:hypothetical protein
MGRVAVMSYVGNGLLIVVMFITMVVEYRRREKNHRKKIQRILAGSDEGSGLGFEEIHSGDVSDIWIGILIALIGITGIGLIFYIAHINTPTILIAGFIAFIFGFALITLRDNTKRKKINRDTILKVPLESLSKKEFIFKLTLCAIVGFSVTCFTIIVHPIIFYIIISLILDALFAFAIVNDYKKLKAIQK